VHHVDAAPSTAAVPLPTGCQPATLQQQRAPAAAAEPRDAADDQRLSQSSRATESGTATPVGGDRAAALPAVHGSVSLAELDGLPGHMSTQLMDSLLLAGDSSITCAPEHLGHSDPSASHSPAPTPASAQPTSVVLTALPAAEVDPEVRLGPPSATDRAPYQSEPADDGLVSPMPGPAPAQPNCTQAASPSLRNLQATDDAESNRAAQLIRQSSMVVHPSTTRDVWPEADAEPELLLDGLENVDDWTPMRDHRAAAPRSGGGLQSPVPPRKAPPGSLSLPLAPGAAMHSQAVAAGLLKEAR